MRERLSLRSGAVLFALWLAGLIGFAVMAGAAAAFSRFPADLWVSHRLQDIDSAAFARAVDWAEDLADSPLLLVPWLGGVAVLFLTAKWWEAALLLFSGFARLVNSGLKDVVERPRPSPDLVDVLEKPGTFAFPSGHVVGAIVLFGLLFYFATALIKQPLLRLLVQAACVYLIAFTAMERIYVGAHWLSDVYGGALLGAVWLAALVWLHRQLVRD
ncbi:MAG: phosphatase PAP2 family protein [Chloroflexi bacterium]|nr:phosphatase PAP2 family protein [Chloroflexota bacterium]